MTVRFQPEATPGGTDVGILTTSLAITAETGLTVRRGLTGTTVTVAANQRARKGILTLLMRTRAEALELMKDVLAHPATPWLFEDEDAPSTSMAMWILSARVTAGATTAHEIEIEFEEK